MSKENSDFDYKAYGARLRTARLEAGYQQIEMGEKIGTSRIQFHHYEKGKYIMPLEWLVIFINEVRKRNIKYGDANYLLMGDDLEKWTYMSNSPADDVKDNKNVQDLEKENERLKAENILLNKINEQLSRMNEQLNRINEDLMIRYSK